jgi:hypothetical protein
MAILLLTVLRRIAATGRQWRAYSRAPMAELMFPGQSSAVIRQMRDRVGVVARTPTQRINATGFY